ANATAHCVALDSAGNVYVGGQENDVTGFPITAILHPGLPAFGSNAIALKLSAAGNALIYSTDFGVDLGAGNIDGIAVDGAGNAYVTGDFNRNFQATPGAFQASNTPGVGGGPNAWAAKLNPAGMALVWGTYLSGNATTKGHGIAIDGAGNAYIVGETQAANFPATPGAFQTARGGGTAAFVTKINNTGTALVYSTFLNGVGGAPVTIGQDIAIDAAGNAYVTGSTTSTAFPTTPGALQTNFAGGGAGASAAFVTKLNATGTAQV